MSLSKPRKQLKTLTYLEKVKVIQEVEKGIKKKCEIAKDFAIPANTLSTILKNKDKILSHVGKDSGKTKKRVKGPENPDIDECVTKWFKQARDKNIPLSGTLVRAKAEEFATTLGKNNFKASTGWLDGFKVRNEISFKTVCGESGGVNMDAANEWKDLLIGMIGETDAKNVFNVDETGLFYKCTPDKTLAFKNEKCSGGKLSKERITVLIGANMDGTEKLPLLVIGKSTHPRCFKNVNSLPVQYEANKKAWMTSDIFESWLLNLNKKFHRAKRTILLFIDNCTAHNSVPSMTNVKVVFFPPNMTSVLQPMDQGVIKNFKHYYRRLVVQKFLAGENIDTNGKVKIDLLQAARLCNNAWDQVKGSTIANCFRKAGFVHETDEEDRSEETVMDVDINEMRDEEETNFQDFINMNEDVAVCGEMTDVDIVNEVMKSGEVSSEEEQEDDQPVRPILTVSQAMDCVEDLRRYVEADKDVSNEIIKCLNTLEQYNNSRSIKSKKQLNISSFFKKL